MEQSQVQVLISRSKQGDTHAFGALVVEFQPLVFRLACRLLCDDYEAKDVVQESFIKIWLNLDKYNPRYQFSTWLYKIASNLCYDKLRSRKHFPIDTKEGIFIASSISSSENIEDTLINKELNELTKYLTKGLTPKQKLIFTLRDVEGLDAGEVEKITGLSAAKVKSNLYLARKYIKEKINAQTL